MPKLPQGNIPNWPTDPSLLNIFSPQEQNSPPHKHDFNDFLFFLRKMGVGGENCLKMIYIDYNQVGWGSYSLAGSSSLTASSRQIIKREYIQHSHTSKTDTEQIRVKTQLLFIENLLCNRYYC